MSAFIEIDQFACGSTKIKEITIHFISLMR